MYKNGKDAGASNEQFMAMLAEDYADVDWDNLPPENPTNGPDVYIVKGQYLEYYYDIFDANDLENPIYTRFSGGANKEEICNRWRYLRDIAFKQSKENDYFEYFKGHENLNIVAKIDPKSQGNKVHFECESFETIEEAQAELERLKATEGYIVESLEIKPIKTYLKTLHQYPDHNDADLYLYQGLRKSILEGKKPFPLMLP